SEGGSAAVGAVGGGRQWRDDETPRQPAAAIPTLMAVPWLVLIWLSLVVAAAIVVVICFQCRAPKGSRLHMRRSRSSVKPEDEDP
ncbi:MAG: hypothetical protein VX747_11070, partial [Actinomycetota bacterium]|nr:hypothetical protein [Actinomycetota bacterium]